MPSVSGGPFALMWIEINDEHWVAAAGYFGLTLLSAIAVILFLRRLAGVRSSTSLLKYLYWVSLPLNVALVVILGSRFAFWPAAAAFTLFVSAFFAGAYSVAQKKCDESDDEDLRTAYDQEG